MKYWGCEGDHLYNDHPHKGERIMTSHNIHEEDEIVEGMGGNMQRIYAALENKKA